MTAQNLNPYDQAPPRAPDVNKDFRGAAKTNPPGWSPVDQTYAHADEDNTSERIVVSHGGVTPYFLVTVDPTGPSVVGVASTCGAITFASATFKVQRTGGGDAAGDVQVYCAVASAIAPNPATLPTFKADAKVYLTSGVPDRTITVNGVPTQVTIGGILSWVWRVRVRTVSQAGGASAGVNERFQLEIP